MARVCSQCLQKVTFKMKNHFYQIHKVGMNMNSRYEEFMSLMRNITQKQFGLLALAEAWTILLSCY